MARKLIRYSGLAVAFAGYIWVFFNWIAIGAIPKTTTTQIKGYAQTAGYPSDDIHISNIVDVCVSGFTHDIPNFLIPGTMMLVGVFILFFSKGQSK